MGWYIVLRLLPGSNRFRRESFARTMSRLVCRPVGVRVRFVDRDRVSRHHPCVYVANHQSQIDYPILGAIYPGNALVMASQIGDWPFMGALFRSSGSLVLDRDVPHRAVAALEQAERAIRDERLSVWMFAEGTRGKARGQLGPFKRGAFRLAATTGVPVVPIVVSPLKPHTDLRGRRLEPHAVTVRVLEPMYPAGGGRENEDALRDAVRARMQTVLDELSGAALPRGYAARGR